MCKFDMPTTTSRPRDTQRTKVYSWEREFFAKYPQAKTELSLAECQRFAKKYWPKKYGAELRVLDGRGRANAGAHFGTRVDSETKKFYRAITMPRWSRVAWIVVHEMAHEITMIEAAGGELFSPAKERNFAAHGPEFMRAYVNLASKIFDIPRIDMIRSFETRGIAICEK